MTKRMNDSERSPGQARAVRASARLRTSASLLGFSSPPSLLRLKLLEGPHYWSLFIQPQADARIASVVEWLEPWSPLRIEFGSRHVLRADFDPLPAAWLDRFRAVELQMLILYPNGAAIASVVGTHAALATFGRALTTKADDIREVRDTPRDTPLLTRAQDEALRAAVEAGYYRIPRPINLQQLAAKLGISSASLSERLRRAEGRIIMRYAVDGATTPWDARTIFDVHTPEGRDEEDELALRVFQEST